MTLAQFLVTVSTSPDALTEFIANPDRAMGSAGLSEGEQQELHSGSGQSVYERIVSPSATAVEAANSLRKSE